MKFAFYPLPKRLQFYMIDSLGRYQEDSASFLHQNPRRHSFSLVAEWMMFLFFLHQYPGGQATESSSCVSSQVKSRGQLRFERKSIDRFLRHQYPGGQALDENKERGLLFSTSLHQKLHLLEKNNMS